MAVYYVRGVRQIGLYAELYGSSIVMANMLEREQLQLFRRNGASAEPRKARRFAQNAETGMLKIIMHYPLRIK